jgi:hypothetical protein
VQFLPTVKVRNSGGPADAIAFRGRSANPTRLLAQGDGTKGILIRNSALKLAGRGGLRLVPQVPPRYLWVDPYGSTTNHLFWDRGYSDDDATVIERSSNGGPWTAVGTTDAANTEYYDPLPTNTVVVWRTVSGTSWQLQAATDLETSGNAWSGCSYVTNGANCVYVEAPWAGHRFYRLKQP